jgi:hypothetical protein
MGRKLGGGREKVEIKRKKYLDGLEDVLYTGERTRKSDL